MDSLESNKRRYRETLEEAARIIQSELSVLGMEGYEEPMNVIESAALHVIQEVSRYRALLHERRIKLQDEETN
jgi:hypothetical protein